MDREFDVVLFGATGFTGKLTAEVLAARAPSLGVRWAIAGRSSSKLEAVRAELAVETPDVASLPVLVADAHDAASLERLVPRARVICTTVGPYHAHGLPLARACAAHGTHYCDLTGETPFVRAVIDSCHERALASSARLVHCAGFDSIPSDLGVLMCADFARRSHGEGLRWAKVFTRKLRGAASGGTVASALGLVELAKQDRDVRRLLADPHALDPVRGEAPRDRFESDQVGVRYDSDLGAWTAPFVMAAINARIVRRSHAMLRQEDGVGYGEGFRYHEAMGMGRGPRGLLRATVVTAAVGGLFAAASSAPLRKLLVRAGMPAPGEGPSREQIEQGMFAMDVLAETTTGKRLRGRVVGTRDPGYGETANMLAETALSLAVDGESLPARFGVLTPATALGMRLVERLRAAKMVFDVADAT